MGFTDNVNVTEVLIVQLEDCPPPPEAPVVEAETVHVSDISPTTRAAEATIEHTGAGPPPKA